MNILKQELKMEKKSLIIWIISLVGVLTLFLMLYPPMSKQMADFQKIFDSFPIEFQRAFGIVGTDLSSILGFYSFIFTYILLAGAVQAMNLSVSILSVEVREKTGDFLFVKPVKRNKIIVMKMLTVLIQIVIVNIVFIASSWVIIHMVNTKSLDNKLYFLLTGSLFFIQIFFASFGFFISVFLKRIRTVLPISMGGVFLFYILFLLNQTLEDVKLDFISPFGYFDLSAIMANHSYDLPFVGLWAVLVVVFIFLTFKIFNKKDLPAI